VSTIKVSNAPDCVKDTQSGAILYSDSSSGSSGALYKYKQRMKLIHHKQQQRKIADQDTQNNIIKLENDVKELRFILEQILERL